MQRIMVMPEGADIKKRKIFIISPIGTALIGYRKGARVNWQVPAGKKTFTILAVNHPFPDNSVNGLEETTALSANNNMVRLS